MAKPFADDAAVLERIVERRIRQKAGRRVRRIRIIVGADRVTVEGQAATYYAKQLAIHALLETVDVTKWTPVVNIECHVAQ